MKRKVGVLLFSFVLAVLLTGCDEVLSVVTAGKDGEKKVNNYASVLSDKVYDETAKFKQLENLSVFDDEDKMLFAIDNEKEKLIFGDEEVAYEISFFDGGYKYTVFSSMDSLNAMFDSFSLDKETSMKTLLKASDDEITELIKKEAQERGDISENQLDVEYILRDEKTQAIVVKLKILEK